MESPNTPSQLNTSIANFFVNRAKLLLVFVGVISLISLAGMLQLQINPSTEKSFPDEHEAVKNFAHFRECFDNDEFIILAYESKTSVFDPDNIIQNIQITDKLKNIEIQIAGLSEIFLPFTRVSSLSNLEDFNASLNGGLSSKRILPKAASALKKLGANGIKARLHKALGADSKQLKLFVSGDQKANAILLELNRPVHLNSRELGELGRLTVEQLRAVVAEQILSRKQVAYVAGAPVVKADIVSALRAELVTFTVPLVAIAAIVALLIFRSVRGLVLPLVVIGFTSLFLFGFMGFAGYELQPMTTLLSPLMFVVGIADSIHVMVELENQTHKGKTDYAKVFDHVLKPCFVTSLTTSIGFASLIFGPISAVREFGLLAAIGTTLAFILTFAVLIPIWCMLPPYYPANRDGLSINRASNWVLKFATPISVFAIVCSIFFGYKLKDISFDTDFVGFFKPESQLRQAVDYIQPRFGGIASLEVLVEGEATDVFSQQTLTKVKTLQQWLEENFEAIDMSFSVVDIVEAGSAKLFGQKIIPPNQTLQLLKHAVNSNPESRSQLNRVMTSDFKVLRISVRTRTMGSEKLSALLKTVRAKGAEVIAKDSKLSFTVTGTPVIFSDSSYTMLFGQIKSFLWALVTITIVMMITLRSVKLGLLSLIPNVFPILVTFGMLSALRIPLNSFNSMVASVAIGIAVDDTIHVLVSFQAQRHRAETLEALRSTIAHTGAAVLATSFMLACGFGVLCLGQFQPTAHFGLLTCISILSAIIGDLFILPWLLLAIERTFGVSFWEPARCKDQSSGDVSGESTSTPSP